MTGFVQSQVLLACVQLDLFGTLSQGPRSVAELAHQYDIDAGRLAVLLDAATELGLLERYRSGQFGLAIAGVSLLAEPGLQSLIRHHRALYRDLEDPLALLRGDLEKTSLGQFWPYASGTETDALETPAVTEYTNVMGDSQGMLAEQVLNNFSLQSFSSLLDVGGGNGRFLAAVAQACPHLKLALFDLPAVLPLARKALTERGIEQRVELHGGNFHQQELPAGWDCVSLLRILHDHDDGPASQLLQTVHRALRPGGTLLIAEPLRQASGDEKMVSVYFSFYLLAMGSGRPRTFAELEAMLLQAGFSEIRHHATPLPLVCSVVSAVA